MLLCSLPRLKSGAHCRCSLLLLRRLLSLLFLSRSLFPVSQAGKQEFNEEKRQLSRSIKMLLETCTSTAGKERGSKCMHEERKKRRYTRLLQCVTGRKGKEDKRITKRSKNVLKLSRLPGKHKEKPDDEDDDEDGRQSGKKRARKRGKEKHTPIHPSPSCFPLSLPAACNRLWQ